MNKRNVLCIGGDLTCNGGIASVIKSYFEAYSSDHYDFVLKLLKTTNYKHSSFLINGFIFLKSIILFHAWLFNGHRGDILHIHSSGYVSFLRKSVFVLLGKLWRRKIILHLHASRFDEFFIHTSSLWHSYISFVFNHSNCIILLCNRWKNELILSYPKTSNKVRICYNPIILKKRNETTSVLKHNNNFHILFIAFLIKSKGIDDLLKTVDSCKAIHKDWIFHIAGTGEYSEKVLFASANNSKIVFHGWADEVLKNKLYQQADVFFLPSRKEGMPIVLLEALSYGVPFVATDIAGIPEIANGDSSVGQICSCGDINGFVKALEYFYSSKDFGNSRKRCTERALAFNNRIVFNQIAEIYQSI